MSINHNVIIYLPTPEIRTSILSLYVFSALQRVGVEWINEMQQTAFLFQKSRQTFSVTLGIAKFNQTPVISGEQSLDSLIARDN